MLKWICNNEVVTRSFPGQDRSEAKSKTFEAELHTSALLGMQWNVYNDTLEVCRGADKEVPNKTTQRAVLSFVASVFDPVGLFAPFTMRMGVLLKTIWAKSRQQCDDNIEKTGTSVPGFGERTSGVKKHVLKSRYSDKRYKKEDLHLSSDASLESRCIVAYLRAEDDDRVELSFAIRECKIALMKKQTIPKLELQAAGSWGSWSQRTTTSSSRQWHTLLDGFSMATLCI